MVVAITKEIYGGWQSGLIGAMGQEDVPQAFPSATTADLCECLEENVPRNLAAQILGWMTGNRTVYQVDKEATELRSASCVLR